MAESIDPGVAEARFCIKKHPPHPAWGAWRVEVRMKSAKYGLKSSPLPPGPAKNRPLRRPRLELCGFLAAPNLDLISGTSFFVFFLISGPGGAPFWDLFPAFWHHFFEYEICIAFISLLGWILTAFSMVF